MNSLWATLHTCPFLLKRMHRLLVVPASIAMIYFDMIVPPLSSHFDRSFCICETSFDNGDVISYYISIILFDKCF